MKRLFLHIGHDKTGSSYLQAALVNSLDALAAHGVHYPVVQQMKYAAKGRISTGNGVLLHSLKQEQSDIRGNTLFSSEMIFKKIVSEDGFKDRLLQIFEAKEVEKLSVFLFIRNPVSHACSCYQQAIKRGGGVMGVEEYFRDHYRNPEEVKEVLEFFEGIPFADVLVKNYDYDRSNLINVFESWLGVPHGTLRLPVNQVVNRSLTHAELEIQRKINFFIGKHNRPLSDLFCNELPHVEPDKLIPPVEIQEGLWKRFKGEIEWINARIPLEARYDKSLDIIEPINDAKDFVFNSEQIEVIAKYLSQHLLAAEDQKHESPAEKGFFERIFGRY